MPRTRVVLYREVDGACPFLEWFDRLAERAQDKIFLRLERLRDLGHELRRPEADYLRDGIYELRASLEGIHYRVLYCFSGRTVAIVSHGIRKTKAVPEREIDAAIRRKQRFEADPSKHTYEEF